MAGLYRKHCRISIVIIGLQSHLSSGWTREFLSLSQLCGPDLLWPRLSRFECHAIFSCRWQWARSHRSPKWLYWQPCPMIDWKGLPCYFSSNETSFYPSYATRLMMIASLFLHQERHWVETKRTELQLWPHSPWSQYLDCPSNVGTLDVVDCCWRQWT